MTLRRRLTVAAAAAVALAVVLACTVAYVTVRDQLHGEIDDQLTGQATLIEQRPLGPRPRVAEVRPAIRIPQPGPREGGPIGYIQVLTAAGVRRPRVSPAGTEDEDAFVLPVDATDRAIARGTRDEVLRDVRVGDAHLRLLTVPGRDGLGAVQLAKPLNSTDAVLSRLRLILALVCLGGVALAAVLGRLVTRRVTAPLREVADAATQVAETDDLTKRLTVTSGDEVGQLALRFNTMLDRLERSRDALASSVESQRQLVADASHELRTPVTSLRTNVEVLLGEHPLEDDARRQLLTDVREQTEELSALVGDVIELARGDAQPLALEEVRLDELTEEVVERFRRHAPDVAFRAEVEPVTIAGSPERLARAVSNLLDNAAKHTPPGGEVLVEVDARGVRVRDHGPGIDAEDLPHLFDRFYRGTTSRAVPGTGLGLAIVRQTAELHGGTATAENADDAWGGARLTLALPGVRPVAAPG